MNAKTRTKLEKLSERLSEILDDVRTYGEEELEKFDNMPEGLQSSERGAAMEEAANNLECVATSIEEAIEYINNVLEV